MRTAPLPPTAFLTLSSSSPEPAPTPPSPTTTLAHLYAHVQAQSNITSSMWRPEARPPLAHARSIHHQTGGGGAGEDGGLHPELHSQYSMIAVVVLTALFFTVTLFATGLLLAFCKKNNTVFSLQKSEQDSNYELDDLDKTSADSRDRDLAEDASSSGRGEHRRSQTFPDLAGSGPPPVPADSSSTGKSALTAGTCRTATGAMVRTAARTGANNTAEGEARRPASVQRSVTVAAIHHHRSEDVLAAATAGDCSVTIPVEDLDSKSEASDAAFDHLYLKLHEEEEEHEGRDDENDDSDDVDDVHNDQTRALLRS